MGNAIITGINVIAPISEAKSIPVNPVSSPIMLPVAHAAKSEDAAASFPGPLICAWYFILPTILYLEDLRHE